MKMLTLVKLDQWENLREIQELRKWDLYLLDQKKIVFQIGVTFTPSEFIRKIPTDAHGNIIELNSKGFDTLEIDFLLTAADAQELVDVMRGHGVNPETGMNRFGEMKCLLENRLGILGSRISSNRL